MPKPSGVDGVQYVACGVHGNARVPLGEKRWFTRMHGTDLQLLDIKRTWTLRGGRFFTEREQDAAGDGDGARLGGRREAVRRRVDPVGQDVTLWNQPFRWSAWSRARAGWCVRRRATTSSTPSTCPTPRPRAPQPDQARRHHRDGGLHRRGVDGEQADRRAAAPAPRHRPRSPTTSPISTQATAPSPPAACRRTSPRRLPATSRTRTCHLEQLAGTLDGPAARCAGCWRRWRRSAAGRRHRHHEHHAALGHRAHAARSGCAWRSAPAAATSPGSS